MFLLSAEKAHHFSFSLLKFLQRIPGVASLFRKRYCINDKRLEREVFGIKFPNPVGIAAGFDKDARLIDELETMGFGFVEIGTVTPIGQEGNPKPRLFRLKKDNAIINRMGFNNEGVAIAIERLKERQSNIIVGGNIGKNKVTPNEDALNDYLQCFDALSPHVDYFTINVSSPNTPNLRELQEKEPLKALLQAIKKRALSLKTPKPVLLKIAPDLTRQQLDDIIEIVQEIKIDGIIATNTTVSRDNLTTDWKKVNDIGAGGVSGKPLTDHSTEIIRYIHKKSDGRIPIIGVGGIMSPQDALKKLKAGASLIQVYTGFIYEGPSLVKRINKAILNIR